jgi:hypothetical protein
MKKKDVIKEFEDFNLICEGVLDTISNLFKRHNRNWYKSAPPIHTTNQFQKKYSSISNYKKNADSGKECEKYGTDPNNMFHKQFGSTNAQFGSKGIVKDISGFKPHPQELRCYDVKNDPKNIAWLFNGDYVAEKIWGDYNNVNFIGTWNGGDFKGIMHEPSEFKGGVMLGKKAGNITSNAPASSRIIKPVKLFSKIIPQNKIAGYVLLTDNEDIEFYSNVLLSADFDVLLKKMKNFVDNDMIDGYGNFPALKFIFPNQGTNSPTIKPGTREYMLMNFFSNLKISIIDNLIDKKGNQDSAGILFIKNAIKSYIV